MEIPEYGGISFIRFTARTWRYNVDNVKTQIQHFGSLPASFSQTAHVECERRSSETLHGCREGEASFAFVSGRIGRGMIGRGWNFTLGFRRIDLIYQVSRATSPMKIVISRRYYVTSSECSLFFFLRLFLRPSRFAFVFLSILVPGLPYIRFSPAVRLRRCRGAVP